MNVTIPPYESIVHVDYWQPPQPSSLMLTLKDGEGREHPIDFLPTFDSADRDYPEEWMRLRRVFVDKYRMKVDSEEEKAVVELLRQLVDGGRLGDEKYVGAKMARECLQYFDKR
ncbi:hypothetical protein [Reichenbachiella sp. 5M10]|uniref:hypothetical protein n=1 Tax=Reichenbachiella sp. 5M10 TaxID=1889772 RepID=UPI00117AC44B|nr:hypothetical protein [Reichenbachiella sp. 5M10]